MNTRLPRGPGDTAPLTAEADPLSLPSHLPSTPPGRGQPHSAAEPRFAPSKMASTLKLLSGRNVERSLENTDVGALGQRARCSHCNVRSSLPCPRAPGASTGLSFLYTSQQPRHRGARAGQDRQGVWQRSGSRPRQARSVSNLGGLYSRRTAHATPLWMSGPPLAKFSLPHHSRCSFQHLPVMSPWCRGPWGPS